MKEDRTEMISAGELVAYCKSISSPVNMNRRCAEIILGNYKSRDISLFTDKEGNIYKLCADGQEVSTSLDDVIDEVCEWNYEDIEAAKNTLKRSNYLGKCQINSQIEMLEKEARALNFIFYQTKYGRNVEKLAERISNEVMEQLNLVPVYDVPFYEDKAAGETVVPEKADQSEDIIPDSQIVTMDSVKGRDMKVDYIQKTDIGRGAR